MAYTKITLKELETNFGIINKKQRLFQNITPVPASKRLQEALEEVQDLNVWSEKARGEMFVLPMLLEIRRNNNKFFTIHSGDVLIADVKRKLTGECDFMLAYDTGEIGINCPILQITEAKRNDIELGISQCAAQLVGASVFNENNGKPLPVIYGCVTNGYEWLFMKLENKQIIADTHSYTVKEEVLGIFQSIIDFYKKTLIK